MPAGDRAQVCLPGEGGEARRGEEKACVRGHGHGHTGMGRVWVYAYGVGVNAGAPGGSRQAGGG